MGAGASAGVTAGILASSDKDLVEAVKALDNVERAKIQAALAGIEGSAEGGAGRKPIIGGNWKCNPAKLSDCVALCKAWSAKPFDQSKIEVFVAPPAIYIATVKDALTSQGISVSAQNCSKTAEGAFTGEMTAGQLKDLDIGYTLIGHSERRTKYGETDEDTALKVEKALAAGVKVVLCIGETLEEREAGKTDEVNQRQLDACIPKITDWDMIVIAYEPVWAIGTGKVATPEQAQETHAAIRTYLAEKVSADVAAKVRIQYGGSASPDNCGDLIKQPDIDGFLVGGASLKAAFLDMVATCSA